MSSRLSFVDEVLGAVGRLLVLAAASAGALFIAGIALKPLLPGGLPTGRDGTIFFAILLASAIAVGHLIAAATIERGRWDPTGLGPGAWRPLALLMGPLLGVVAVLAPAVVLLLAGSVGFVPAPGAGWAAFAGNALFAIATLALVEELVYRGYAIGVIAERWGNAAAVLLTTLVAVMTQLFDPTFTGLSVLGVMALTACLGAIRLRTGSVAASWLAHVGFAATQTALLHAPLRGSELPGPPGYALVAGPPAWLTGGAQGLSDGVAVAASLALVTFLVFRPRRANTRPARV
jgi:membrane protease YdiL (CAAX protease family)